MNKRRLSLLFILLSTSTVFSAGIIRVQANSPSAPFMRLSLDIDPHTQFLEARAKLSELPAEPGQVFFLNKSLKIASLTAKEQPVRFKFELDGKVPPYARAAAPLTIQDPIDEFTVEYSGAITETIAGLNMISSDLVELALYAAFHPFNLDRFPEMTYELDLTLPSAFKVATNGELMEKQVGEEKTRYRFQVRQASPDVVIAASPHFEVESRQFGSWQVDMLHTEKGRKLLDGRVEDMGNALLEFEERFGQSAADGVLRCVYSPRYGWGYVRLPYFVVSENEALDALTEPFERQMNIRYAIHEISHFWWFIAKTLTELDWINEGLAEYTALSQTIPLYGESFRRGIIKEYVEHIRKAKTDSPIVATELPSPDREINWYKKTALLLYVFERQVGRNKLDGFLADLHKRYKSNKSATTEGFFQVAKDHFEAEEFQFLKSYLVSSGWSQEQLGALAEKGDFADLL